jgi:hypothetical protein
MKARLTAAILAAAMTLAFAGCESDSGTSGSSRRERADSERTNSTIKTFPDTSSESEEPTAPDEIRTSRTYAALSLLREDTYMLRLNIDGIDFMTAYRRRNAVSIFAASIHSHLIADGYYYTFAQPQGKVYYRLATDEDIRMVLEGLDGFDQIIDLEGAVLVDSGVAPFMNHGDMCFEEFRLADGSIRRTFFNADDELFGIQGGTHPNIVFHVSANVPDYVFEIPAELVRTPESMR